MVTPQPRASVSGIRPPDAAVRARELLGGSGLSNRLGGHRSRKPESGGLRKVRGNLSVEKKYFLSAAPMCLGGPKLGNLRNYRNTNPANYGTRWIWWLR